MSCSFNLPRISALSFHATILIMPVSSPIIKEPTLPFLVSFSNVLTSYMLTTLPVSSTFRMPAKIFLICNLPGSSSILTPSSLAIMCRAPSSLIKPDNWSNLSFTRVSISLSERPAFSLIFSIIICLGIFIILISPQNDFLKKKSYL